MLSELVQTTPTGSPGKAVGDLMNTRYFSDSGSHGSPPRSGCSTPEAPRCLPKGGGASHDRRAGGSGGGWRTVYAAQKATMGVGGVLGRSVTVSYVPIVYGVMEELTERSRHSRQRNVRVTKKGVSVGISGRQCRIQRNVLAVSPN